MNTHDKTDPNPNRAVGGRILCALLAASARLAVTAGIAAWLFVMLLNEIAAALVYAIAAMLALLFWSCPG
jgi:hypothetical protein